MIKHSVDAIPLIKIDISTLGDAYKIELSESCFIIRYTNQTDQDIIISHNHPGNEVEIIPSGQSVQLSFYAQPEHFNSKGYLPKGTYLYPFSKPGTGYLYISGYYFVNGR